MTLYSRRKIIIANNLSQQVILNKFNNNRIIEIKIKIILIKTFYQVNKEI